MFHSLRETYLVCPAFLWLSTAFQTLLTQGQVVSTTFTPLHGRKEQVRGVRAYKVVLDSPRQISIAQDGTKNGQGLTWHLETAFPGWLLRRQAG
jgi:hypothetical protein